MIPRNERREKEIRVFESTKRKATQIIRKGSVFDAS